MLSEKRYESLKEILGEVKIKIPEEQVISSPNGTYIVKSGDTLYKIASINNTTVDKLKELKPVILDLLPLNLEDIFIYEMEANGYDFSKILL